MADQGSESNLFILKSVVNQKYGETMRIFLYLIFLGLGCCEFLGSINRILKQCHSLHNSYKPTLNAATASYMILQNEVGR